MDRGRGCAGRGRGGQEPVAGDGEGTVQQTELAAVDRWYPQKSVTMAFENIGLSELGTKTCFGGVLIGKVQDKTSNRSKKATI